MALPNGGLTAPAPPQVGLGSVRRPRSVNRRQTPRGQKIAKSVAEQRRARNVRDGMPVTGRNAGIDPGYGRPPASPAASIGARPPRMPERPRPRQGVGNAVNADLGAQLSRRVASGAIGQAQAEQVARDRATLERAYGPNWRDRVFGGAGKVRRLRQTANSAEPGDSKSRLADLMAKRKSFLEKAKAA